MYFGDWQYLDWENVPGALDWLGFILGGLGIVVAIVQLFRSRNALIAARESLEDAKEELVSGRLRAAIPRLQEGISSLGSAIDHDDRILASIHLTELSRRNAEVRVLLELIEHNDSGLMSRMLQFDSDFTELEDQMRLRENVALRTSIGRSMGPLRKLSTDLEAVATRSQNTLAYTSRRNGQAGRAA